MPKHIKIIGRCGNWALTVLSGLLAIMLLTKGQPGGFLFMLLFSALGGFNLYVLEKCIGFFSEEELLQAEVRKAELRRKLADMAADARA